MALEIVRRKCRRGFSICPTRQADWAELRLQLLSYFEDLDHRRLGTLSSGCNIEAAQIRRENAGARAFCCLDSSDFPVVIRALLLNNGNSAFSARGVNAFPLLIEKNVVAITNSRKCLHDLPASCIHDQQSRRQASHYEEPVICLVQRHCIVGE